MTNNLGVVERKTFFTYGKKNPFSKIRVALFNKHQKYMRLNSDSYFENLTDEEVSKRLITLNEFEPGETITSMRDRLKTFERTRNLAIWHDASSIANHGHILINIHVLYDPAVFYTSDEYEKNTNIKLNIQREVEEPVLHIIGRCRSNDEQLGYIETRLECIKSIQNDLDLGSISQNHQNIKLKDSIRFFKGDGPAIAFECGNKKGGTYFCPCCDVNAYLTDDISYCYQLPIRSIEDARQRVVAGKLGKKHSLLKKTCPFEKLKPSEVFNELKSRKVNLENMKKTKKELLPVLNKHLCGSKRVPVLLFHDPLASLDKYGIEKYEMSMVEPMHDVAEHFENLLVILPLHLPQESLEKFKNLYDLYNEEKEKKRCCDKRKFLLLLTKELYLEIDGKIHRVLKTLSEIQRILYLGDDFRNAKEVLRLHNSSFQHFVLLRDALPFEKLGGKMSREKMYGKYQHNLCVHAPFQYRLTNCESLNCEDEERCFNAMKKITKDTTNYDPAHFIDNIFVRSQVEGRCQKLYKFSKKQNATFNAIATLGKEIEKSQSNTLFTYDFIKENLAEWQSHLERISDFLIFGEGIWWQKTEFGVEFFDVENNPTDINVIPKVHHFRSADIKLVNDYLKMKWEFIVQNGICIPSHKIITGDLNEIPQYTKTNFFNGISVFDTDDVTNVTNNRIENCDGSIEDDEESENFVLESSEGGHYPLISNRLSNGSLTLEQLVLNTFHASNASIELNSTNSMIIFFVLRDIPSVLSDYDKAVQIVKRLQESNLAPSGAFTEKISLIKEELRKMLCDYLFSTTNVIDTWENEFLKKNNNCLPTITDIINDKSIYDHKIRMEIGQKILQNWSIPFLIDCFEHV